MALHQALQEDLHERSGIKVGCNIVVSTDRWFLHLALHRDGDVVYGPSPDRLNIDRAEVRPDPAQVYHPEARAARESACLAHDARAQVRTTQCGQRMSASITSRARTQTAGKGRRVGDHTTLTEETSWNVVPRLWIVRNNVWSSQSGVRDVLAGVRLVMSSCEAGPLCSRCCKLSTRSIKLPRARLCARGGAA